MASPLLWQNNDGTATLLDIPHSIAAAQHSNDEPNQRQLLSSIPLQTPFPSNEPKSATAEAKLKNNTVNAGLHDEYQSLLLRALECTKTEYRGGWCLPRYFATIFTNPKKRKLDSDHDEIEANVPAQVALPEMLLPCLARGSHGDVDPYDGSLVTTSDSMSTGKLGALDPQDVRRRLYENESTHRGVLRVTVASPKSTYDFQIPPKASFYLGDCTNSRHFHAAVRSQALNASTRKHFDFILLDPPWPNRSVKRTHKTAGSSYSTLPTLSDLRELILDMKLDLFMDKDCLVAMWVTNNPGVRELVLGENGLFECWDVDIVEEWLWLKTTAHGEPVTQLSNLWRKPYEVLLLGRRRDPTTENRRETHPPRKLKRRVIMAVPDLHSRKPCLKEMIEPLMSDSKNYRALEVFARHLVTGWWSWGDECIKFNWEGFWRDNDGIT